MPDQRRHRGPHPQDEQRFAAKHLPRLCEATRDLSWLLTRGYASVSALKLVGDRYRLDARQRLAVARCACSDDQAERRSRSRVGPRELLGQEMWIDGYNVLTTIEAALSGGIILHARDDCLRDMASMHGSYRKVSETVPALQLLGEVLDHCGVAECHWLLDKSVSNSGRLKTILGAVSQQNGWQWQTDLVPDPDPVLMRAEQIVATADSQILDQARQWFNLAKSAIELRIPHAWLLDLWG